MGIIPLVGIVCRSGGQYGPDHANWLCRQIPIWATPVIFSDFPEGLFNAPVYPLRKGWPGWWAKMELFAPDGPPQPILYADLDTVIRDLRPEYWQTPRSMMLSDFYFPERPASGFMLIRPEDRAEVWNTFCLDPNKWMENFKAEGDQGFIGKFLTADRWQDKFPGDIISYKAHLAPSLSGKRFQPGADIDAAKVICFHGKPKPWEIVAPWMPPLVPSAVAPQ